MLTNCLPADTNGYSAALIDRLPVALLFFDSQNRLLSANQTAAAFLALPLAEQIGLPVRNLCPEIADLLESTPLHQEISMDCTCAGRTFRAYVAPVQDMTASENRLVLLWNQANDPEKIKFSGSHSRHEIPITALFEAVLESIRHGILVTDQQGLPVYHNPSLKGLWDMPESAFEEAGPGWPVLLSRRLKHPERLVRLIQTVHDQPGAEMYDFLELTDGRVLECHSRLQFPMEGIPPVRVWSFEDITEQQRTERELHYLSTHDGLTGLYNRAFFELQFRQLYTFPAYPVSMIMVDVDGLKKVNDRLGHLAGDHLLCQAADVLRKACRSDDVIARLGGDEFGLVLLRTNTDSVDRVCERILHLQTLQRINHPGMPLSLSMGSATANNSAELADLFNRADANMYHVRRRNRSAQLSPRQYVRKGKGG